MDVRKKLGIVAGLAIIALFLLLYFLLNYSPLEVGPAGILVVFVMIYVVVCTTLMVIANLSWNIVLRMKGKEAVSFTDDKRLMLLVAVVGLAPVLLLGLNSIGQLDIKDFILVAILVSIASFYVLRRNKA